MDIISQKNMKPNHADAAKRLGQAIRKRRKSLGLTQKKLAEFAGCGVVYVYMLEAGKPTIRMDKLMDVLKILGLGLTLSESREGLSIAHSTFARG